MNSLHFTASLGINPGYDGLRGGTTPEGEGGTAPSVAWMSAMEAERVCTGITVSAFVLPGRVIYPSDHGCPGIGEIAVRITGESNPKFDVDLAAYRAAVMRVVEAVKTALGQKTARVSFQYVHTEYMT